MATDDRLLTVEEVARRVSASEYTVRKWLREGKLKGRKIGGDRLGYRVRESDLELFIGGDTVMPPDRDTTTDARDGR